MKEEGKTPKKAKDICNAVWFDHKKKNEDTVEIRANAEMRFIINEDKTESVEIVAAIGNRFMNGGFLTLAALKKSTKFWNNTLHDIDHKGIGSWGGMNIEYFIGWHNKAKMNGDALVLQLNLDENTQNYKVWKSYVGLLKKADKIPNVSVVYMASIIWKTAKEIEELTPKLRKQAGFNKDDLVPLLEDIKPIAVSTVVIGRCNDKDGCGIKNNECECDSCKDGKCEIPDNDNNEKEEKELERQKLIQKIKILKLEEK